MMFASDSLVPFIRDTMSRSRIFSVKCAKCNARKEASVGILLNPQVTTWALGIWSDGWCEREGECLCPECAWGGD